MRYEKSKYCADNSTAIRAINSIGECEFVATVCLVDYGLIPQDEFHAYIPAYKLRKECLDKILSDIVEEIEKKEYVGYNNSCECWYVKLKKTFHESDDFEPDCADSLGYLF